jgi:hypothetical protein
MVCATWTGAAGVRRRSPRNRCAGAEHATASGGACSCSRVAANAEAIGIFLGTVVRQFGRALADGI